MYIMALGGVYGLGQYNSFVKFVSSTISIVVLRWRLSYFHMLVRYTGHVRKYDLGWYLGYAEIDSSIDGFDVVYRPPVSKPIVFILVLRLSVESTVQSCRVSETILCTDASYPLPGITSYTEQYITSHSAFFLT